MIIPSVVAPTEEGLSARAAAGDLEFTSESDSRPIVPERNYQVIFVKSEKCRYFGGHKLYLTLEICEAGEFLGVKLFKAYNLYEKLPVGSDLHKDLVMLYGKRVRKNTKLSLSLFRGKVLEVTVRTVRLDRKQGVLREHQQYSVVDRIVGVLAGGQA